MGLPMPIRPGVVPWGSMSYIPYMECLGMGNTFGDIYRTYRPFAFTHAMPVGDRVSSRRGETALRCLRVLVLEP